MTATPADVASLRIAASVLRTRDLPETARRLDALADRLTADVLAMRR